MHRSPVSLEPTLDIVQVIRERIPPGTVIPKPRATQPHRVKGWARRRGEPALVYLIPNNKGGPPYVKGIAESEFRATWARLCSHCSIDRAWFLDALPQCAAEGSCNFTTLGGLFELLGVASYESGRYVVVQHLGQRNG